MKPPYIRSKDSTEIWRLIQFIVWLFGFYLLYALFFIPTIGVLLFWKVLIPIAPVIFLVAAGIWRNVCPMASTVLFPRHLGWTNKQRLSLNQQGRLSLMLVVLLFLIVPLRHPVFNNNGMATGYLIVFLTAIGCLLRLKYR